MDRHRCHVGKVLTTVPDPSAGVLQGIPALLEASGIAPEAVGGVIHGTTLVTNALIERRGARTALLTTAGFRDALEIGTEGRYDIYDLGLVKPAPLVERRLRFEVPERMNAAGAPLRAPGPGGAGADLRRAALGGHRGGGGMLPARVRQPRARGRHRRVPA